MSAPRSWGREGRRRTGRLAVAAACLVLPATGCDRAAAESDRRAAATEVLARAAALEARGELDRALDAYREAMEARPLLLPAALGYARLGTTLWRTREVARRLEARAASASPGERAPLRALAARAGLDRRTHDPEARRAAFRALRAEAPSSPWPHLVFHHPGRGVVRELPADSGRRALDACLRLDPRFAPCLVGRGRLYLDAGEPEEAVPRFSAALAGKARELDPDAAVVGLAEALARTGRGDSAAALLERRHAGAAERGAWAEHRSARHLLGRTSALLRSEPPPAAAERMERLRKRAEETVRRGPEALPTDLARAHALVAVAGLARRAGDPLEAHRLRLRALGSTPSAYPAWAASHRQELCRSAWKLGRLEEARVHCREAARAFRAAGDSTELMSAAHVASHVHAELGRLAEARERAAEHLALAERAGHAGHRVSALHDLGWLLWRQGEREAARDLLDRMAAIAEADGRWLYEAASFHETLGDWETAIRLYHRGVADGSPAGLDRWGNYTRSLLGLSRLYLRTGRAERALEYGRAYEAHVRRLGLFELPLPNLSEIYRAMGRHDDALRHARRWLDELQASSAAAAHLDRARREVARSHLAADRPGEAVPILRSLLGGGERIGDPAERVELQLALADALLRLERPDEAAPLLATAADRARALRNPELGWRVADLEGRRLEAIGDPRGGLAAYEEAILRLERTRAYIVGPELRSGFFSNRLAPYEAALRLRVAPESPLFDVEAAFRLSEKKKARTLLELVTADPDEGSADAPARVLEERTRIAGRLAALRDRLAAAAPADGLPASADGSSPRVGGSLAPADPPSLLRLRSEADSLALRHDRLLARLRGAAPRLSALEGLGAPISVRKLQRVLGDRALVAYAGAGERLHALVVTRNRAEARVLPIQGPEVERRVLELRRPLEELRRGEIGLAHVRWDLASARRLYRGLVEPVEDLLAGVDEIIIVPEGVLWTLPFEALVREAARLPAAEAPGAVGSPGPAGHAGATGRSGPPGRGALFSEYAAPEYLLDRWEVSYAPSATLLHPDLWAGRVEGRGFLVVGTPPAAGGRAGVPGGGRIGGGVGGVPGVPGGRRAETLSGEAATQARILAAMEGRRWIHFATHGTADPGSPDRSALLLGPSGDRLEAHEIAGLHLAAELVTLGACETAVGPTRPGEGSLALTRAFMLAGVPSVVASLWAVPAEAEALWPAFYAALEAGEGKARALRRAKLALRGETFFSPDGTRVSLAHPVFWAPYVLVGRP